MIAYGHLHKMQEWYYLFLARGRRNSYPLDRSEREWRQKNTPASSR
jgi:beta-xylosidase